MPSAAGLTACQTSTYGWPRTSTSGRSTAGDDAALLGAGHQVVDQHAEPAPALGREVADRVGQVVDAVQRLHHDRLDPQVVAPDPLDQRRVVHALDPDPAAAGDLRAESATATEPEAVRPGRRAPGAAARPDQGDRPAVEQEAGRAEREDAAPAAPVLQRHRVLGAADDRAAEAGGGLLDHQVRLGGDLRHDRPAPPVAGQHVRAVVPRGPRLDQVRARAPFPTRRTPTAPGPPVPRVTNPAPEWRTPGERRRLRRHARGPGGGTRGPAASLAAAGLGGCRRVHVGLPREGALRGARRVGVGLAGRRGGVRRRGRPG